MCVARVYTLFLSFYFSILDSLIRCLVAMLHSDSVMYLGQATDIIALLTVCLRQRRDFAMLVPFVTL